MGAIGRWPRMASVPRTANTTSVIRQRTCEPPRPHEDAVGVFKHIARSGA